MPKLPITPKLSPEFNEARLRFHAELMRSVLTRDVDGIVSNADRKNHASVQIAARIFDRLKTETRIGTRLAAQTSGNEFEDACTQFLQNTFHHLQHLRPGTWEIRQVKGRGGLEIANFEQYSHLLALEEAAGKSKELRAALGNAYVISPDIIVLRKPEPDAVINKMELLVDETHARHTSLRVINGGLPLLHASISCKWTMRSDRSQNSRSEALTLIRNRKGHLPHAVAIIAEPLPSRIASLAWISTRKSSTKS